MVSQLRDKIFDHFEASSRGNLIGKNDQGVEVETILLSLETSGWDGSVLTASTNNGFDVHGLDSLSDRTSEVRDGFSFYRGVASTGPPGSLGFAQRRRIVVVDATEPGSPLVRHNDLPLSSGALDATNVELIRAAINNASITPAGTTFEAWATENLLSAGSASPLDDPDGDGWQNALEFSAGTDPSNGSSFPVLEMEQTEIGFELTFTRFVPAIELVRTWQTGPLESITTAYIPENEEVTVENTDDPDIEKVTVTLPADFGPYIRLKVRIE